MANHLGVCKIKTDYLLPESERKIDLNVVSEKDKDKLDELKTVHADSVVDDDDTPATKRQKFSKNAKNKLKGQNKAIGPTYRRNNSKELCNTLVDVMIEDDVPKCMKNKCEFIHDVQEYLSQKPADIGSVCYNFEQFGHCTRGLACRFGALHITENGKNQIIKEKVEAYKKCPQTKNFLDRDLQHSLRKREYDFSLSEKLIKYNDESNKTGAVLDEDIVKLTQREKKKLNWHGKIMLSPLTTVGNLPFRRICKEFGADITCGEMAMCTSLLQAAPQEWALIKRHHTEDIFGVQLCANNPYVLTKCAELLEKVAEIDYIDLNLGCPIELIYKNGGGCGLLRRTKVLEKCIKNLCQITSLPVAIKTRTGVYENEKIAHTLAPKYKDWGASLITIHGRSREQRYTKLADWKYIAKVAEAADPLPVFGNGDILSYDDYKMALESATKLAGVTIGRGALIKPWLFTEIKEQRLWDIRSQERFDILKKYTNYGLEHWGSDNKGVENTRRFMLEWLSFLYRYVPVGVLEQAPQKINERPPLYKGRDELETLMASPSASDWIKITEMLLGPVPDNFHFVPKHKANSYK